MATPRARGELAAFQQGDAQAAQRQVVGHTCPGGSATDDHDVCRCRHRRSMGKLTCYQVTMIIWRGGSR
jgi:hypothetical protein